MQYKQQRVHPESARSRHIQKGGFFRFPPTSFIPSAPATTGAVAINPVQVVFYFLSCFQDSTGVYLSGEECSTATKMVCT